MAPIGIDLELLQGVTPLKTISLVIVKIYFNSTRVHKGIWSGFLGQLSK